MRFNSGKFNTFLGGIGQNVRWRRAYACPCFDENSGAATYGCPACAGKGHIWNDPVDCVVGVPSQKVQAQWAQFGQWEDGDALVTVGSDSPMYAAGRFDRVLFMNASDAFSQPLLHDGTERLNLPVSAISRVFWLDAQSRIVEGGIPVVNADGSLTWGAGAPPLGVKFTISGTKFSEYFVFNSLPNDRNEHQGMPLPTRMQLRRFDLLGR
jgi:hypothetical protein